MVWPLACRAGVRPFVHFDVSLAAQIGDAAHEISSRFVPGLPHGRYALPAGGVSAGVARDFPGPPWFSRWLEDGVLNLCNLQLTFALADQPMVKKHLEVGWR